MTKHIHQPFNDWLFGEEPLQPEESARLAEHLRICADCQRLQSAWMQTGRLFVDAGQLAPAPGFVMRWQQRLAQQRILRQRKIAWAWFGASAGLASLALTVLGYLAFASTQSPLSFVAVMIYRLTVAVSYWNVLTGYLSFFQDLWPSISWVGLSLLVGMVSFLSVLWLATFRRLSTSRRVVI